MKIIDSPIGTIRLFAEAGALSRILLPAERGEPLASASTDGADDEVLSVAARQLEEYFAGRRRSFDIPLRASGTDFQHRVWRALGDIPFGETRSYRDIARTLGRPEAVRAVGAANARNPLPVVIPCHRVIGSDGSLTGYGGGEPTKRWLLDHERGRFDAQAGDSLRAFLHSPRRRRRRRADWREISTVAPVSVWAR